MGGPLDRIIISTIAESAEEMASDEILTAHIGQIYVDRDDDNERPRYIVVKIYETVEGMRKAAAVYDKKRFGPPDDYEDAGALYQPTAHRSKYDRHKRQWVDTSSRCAGVIRMHREFLDGEVVAHESVHAALHLWRSGYWHPGIEVPDANLGDNGGPVEERFALLVGAIASELSNIVWTILREVS